MAGEDEVEAARFHAVDHLREVAEQDAEVCVRVGEALRPGPARTVRAGIDADDLHLLSPQLDRLGVVEKQSRRSQFSEFHPLRKRIPRDGMVVVSENGVAARESGEQLPEKRFTTSPG